MGVLEASWRLEILALRKQKKQTKHEHHEQAETICQILLVSALLFAPHSTFLEASRRLPGGLLEASGKPPGRLLGVDNPER